VETDAEIFRRSIRDPDAFREIFERHAGAVHAYARRRIGMTAGEEILAQTFLTAFEKRARFDTSYGSARPWLLGIATNLIRHHLREEREHLTALRKIARDQPEVPADDEARLDAQRLKAVLLDSLLAISDEDRETFLLLALGQLTYEEVASALGIPIGTVRSRIHRARRHLRERVPTWTAIDDGTEGSERERPETDDR
jgi:RNA polymerase sigma-70 factor (ECF subfamily)